MPSVAISSGEVQTINEVVTLHVREGSPRRAIRDLEVARGKDPKQLSYRMRLVGLRRELGDIAGVKAELERAIVDFGTKPELTEALRALPK